MDELKAEIEATKNSSREELEELRREQIQMLEVLKRWETERTELQKGLDGERMKAERRKTDELLAEERTKREVAERELEAHQSKSFRKRGSEFAKEVPFVPTWLLKPSLVAGGALLDVAQSVRKGPS